VIFTASHLSKLKFFLKKATKKGDKTKRKIWFNLFPHLPLTKKPANVRMGKGKGKLKTWFINVRGGSVFVEYRNVRYGRINYFFKQASFKLGIPVIKLFVNNIFFKFPMQSNKKIFFQTFWN
jgi:large subunit ribosomal protein L16